MTEVFTTVTKLGVKHGLGHSQIREYLAEAGLPTDARGRYEQARADHILQLRKNEARSIERALNSQSTTVQAGRSEALAALAEARRLSALEDLRMKRLKGDRLEGSLISRNAVEASGKALVAQLRKSLASIPVTIAPKLVGQTDSFEIAATIKEEIERAMGALFDDAKTNAILFGERSA